MSPHDAPAPTPWAAPYRIAPARSAADFASARALMLEYAQGLGVDLCFQNFAAELERLPEMYGPPAGALLLAFLGEEAVGCVALRPHDAHGACEMKRLYVRGTMRGSGVGRALAAAIVERARSAGYRRMLLDTLGEMHAARRVYASLGFAECAPYYANPLDGVIYMALELGSSAA